jgi:hypothetical protein
MPSICAALIRGRSRAVWRINDNNGRPLGLGLKASRFVRPGDSDMSAPATPVDADDEPWPAEADQLRMYALPLVEHIFAVTAPDSPTRAAAMGEVFTAVARIRLALRPKPTLQ